MGLVKIVSETGIYNAVQHVNPIKKQRGNLRN